MICYECGAEKRPMKIKDSVYDVYVDEYGQNAALRNLGPKGKVSFKCQCEIALVKKWYKEV